MKAFNIVAALWLVCGVVAAPGCAEDIPPGASSQYQGGNPVPGGNPAPGASPVGGAAVTYAQIKPALAVRCGPCHAANGSAVGAHSLVDSSASAKLAATSPECVGRTKGECAYIRVRSGTMPPRMMCTGNPAQDTGKPKCLTQEEQLLLYGWITGGLQ
jgi:hypothetical protein